MKQPLRPGRSALLAALLLLLALVPNAEAHLLRAAYEQCVAALGEPITTDVTAVAPATQAFKFRDSGWVEAIQFWRGKAHAISFSKGDGSRITTDELLGLLDEFSDGKDWDRDEAIYTRHDGQILAVRGKHNDFLLLTAEFAVSVRRFPW